jgi:hypothetical protein
MEKNVILLCSDNGKIRSKTLKRLKNAMGPKTKENHLHLAIEVLIERTPSRWGGSYWAANSKYGMIASMTEVFPEICHLTLAPVQNVQLDGARSYSGELCLASEREFEGRVKEYYEYVNAEYKRKRPYYTVWDEKLQMRVKRPQGLEIHWGCLQLVGGVKFRDWDPVGKKGYWRLKREGVYRRMYLLQFDGLFTYCARWERIYFRT